MNTSTLTYFEQRGTLTYVKDAYTFKTVEGWFYIDGSTVVMRKVGGRNRFQLCNVDGIYEFTPHK